MTLLGISKEKMQERMKKYQEEALNQTQGTNNDKTKSNSSSFVAPNNATAVPHKEKE